MDAAKNKADKQNNKELQQLVDYHLAYFIKMDSLQKGSKDQYEQSSDLMMKLSDANHHLASVHIFYYGVSFGQGTAFAHGKWPLADFNSSHPSVLRPIRTLSLQPTVWRTLLHSNTILSSREINPLIRNPRTSLLDCCPWESSCAFQTCSHLQGIEIIRTLQELYP